MGEVQSIPTAGNYKSNLKEKGFEDDEIVALASIESFGLVWDPKSRDGSPYPKLDNYHYKQLLAGKGVVLQDALTKDAELKKIVEKFAQDKKAYHDSFGKAFIKMVTLGHENEELVHVENLLEDHPYKVFIESYY